MCQILQIIPYFQILLVPLATLRFIAIIYLFIFVKKEKKKKKRRSPQTGFANCNAVNFYYITFALFFLIHCQTFFPLYQYSYTKKNTFSKKYTQKKKLKVYMTSQIINSETKTILKLNTYIKNKKKQRIKQNTSKLSIYIYIYLYLSY